VASSAAAPLITAPPANFADPAGDGGTAPDITNIAITNDDHGQYTFTVTLAAPYPNAGVIVLFLDTDKNAGTGDPNLGGPDFVFSDDRSTHTFNVAKWDATAQDYLDAPFTTASVTVSPDGLTVTFSINKSELGDTTGFNFFGLTFEGDGSDGVNDIVDFPQLVSYAYQTIFTLSLANGSESAAKVGGTWKVSMSATRSDTNATVGSEATITCVGTAGKKKLAVASKSFVSSGSGGSTSAVCVFKIPKTLKKKTAIHSTITITDAGQSVSDSFTTKTK
jgi:hypothetical protein